MSVLIPNMNKPKSCTQYKDKFRLCPMTRHGYCVLQSDNCDNWDTWEQQYEHCPLIEVKDGDSE